VNEFIDNHQRSIRRNRWSIDKIVSCGVY